MNVTGVVSYILQILILGWAAVKFLKQVGFRRKFTSVPFAFVANNTANPGFATAITIKVIDDEAVSWYKKRVTFPKHFQL